MTRIEQHRTGNGPGDDDRAGHGRAHRADPRHAGPHLGGRAGTGQEQRAARSSGPRHAAGHERTHEPEPTSAPGPERPDAAALQVFPAVREPEPTSPPAAPGRPAGPPLMPQAPQSPAAPSGEAVGRTAPGRPACGLGPWLDARAVQEVRADWERTQIAFVDDPAGSVAAADGLVGRTADLIAEAVRRRLEDLREGCRTPDEEPGARTEHLRLAMRDYRAALDRLLA
ncbi:hypothetical protein [Kitasatospora sp. NPDC050463]|uniref:hypothetical protein n=1 Tax=Kitasatospora sp. NPDC050463 TaxID=3155786 RepID=UPI00340F621E